jgi:uncharacterized protein YggE
MRTIEGLGLALAATAVVSAVAAAQEQREEPRRLTVTATAMVERAPERAVALLAVESQAETAQAASQQNATSMEQVIAALRSAGVEGANVRTVSYQLNPVYIPAQRGETGPRISGYRAVNMVQVRVDALDRLGPIIDAAIAAGANRVASLSFELRDAEAARLEAVQDAVRKAAREAEAVASAAGQRLGPPLDIQTSTHMPMPGPMYERVAMAAADVQASTPVEAGTISIQATVTIVYQLEMP